MTCLPLAQDVRWRSRQGSRRSAVSDWYEDDVDHTDDGAEPDEDELFDWDDGNLYKLDDHRLTVEETQEACLDPDRKPAQAYSVDNERRAALVGATHSDRILFVLYT